MKHRSKKPDAKQPDAGDGATGFNDVTQKLLCLITLDDRIGAALSDRAGTAFFRAFVVEDRKTGDVSARHRFRYTHGDSWYAVTLSPEKQKLSRDEKVGYLAERIESFMQQGCEKLAGMKPPKKMMERFYPPEPEDGGKTIQWLIEQDLVEVTSITIDGQEIEGADA
jgi:hypothetical protein